MLSLHGDDFRYVAAWDKFICWRGTRWEVDQEKYILHLAQRTARSIYREAGAERDTAKRRALVEHARATEATPRIKAMLAQVVALPGVAIKPSALDADPWLLNCANGTVNLRTGELQEHLRDDLITKSTGIRYDATAKCPLWQRFLDRVQPDPAVQTFLGRLAGYALTADVGEHVLPIHWGKGRNGKGVYTNARLHAIGDYATAIPTELLMVKRGDAHPTERTVLFGCRFAAASESEEGRHMNVALVKQLTGGDAISARRMREDFWSFEPTHKIELSTNHRPVIRETSDAIWERVMLIPWGVQVPKGERDKSLGTKLKAEASGILAWAVRHCLAWQKDGLAVPDCVRAATANYRESEDMFAMFLDETCVLDTKAVSGATDLQKAYAEWAEGRNEKELSHKALSAKLEERGFLKGKDTRTNCVTWQGLGLAPSGGARASAAEPEITEEELDRILRDGVAAEVTEDAVDDPVYPHMRARIAVHPGSPSASSASSAHDPSEGDASSQNCEENQAVPASLSATLAEDPSGAALQFSRPSGEQWSSAYAPMPILRSLPNAIHHEHVLDPALPHGERSVRVVRGFADTGRLELDVPLGADVTRVPHDTPFRGTELEAYVFSIVDERQLTVALFEQRQGDHGVGCHIVGLRRPTSSTDAVSP
jgi:putative DNA primase/helicase